MSRKILLYSASVFLIILSNSILAANNDAGWKTDNNNFLIQYTTLFSPLPLNQIHNWTLYLTTLDGEPVENATIEVTGGMPAHNHGMPTAPQVTPSKEPGNYELQGVRFHMMGYWELSLTIHVGDIQDTVVIPVEI